MHYAKISNFRNSIWARLHVQEHAEPQTTTRTCVLLPTRYFTLWPLLCAAQMTAAACSCSATWQMCSPTVSAGRARKQVATHAMLCLPQSQYMLLRNQHKPGSSLPFCTSILYSACSTKGTDNDEMCCRCRTTLQVQWCSIAASLLKACKVRLICMCKCSDLNNTDADINRIFWALYCRHVQHQHLCAYYARPIQGIG